MDDKVKFTLPAEEMRATQQRALMARLSRIEGQIRGIRRMMEKEEGCEQVAQQLAAARNALSRCFYEMMACAIEHELAPQKGIEDEVQQRVNHLTRVLSKYG